MNIWIIETGEPLPIDDGARLMRAGILANMLVEQGHKVTWWASNFNHFEKKHRFDGPRSVEIQPGLQLRLLHAPGYSRNNSPARFSYHRSTAKAFAIEAINASKEKPEVIFCCLPTLELAEQAVIFGQRTGIPVVIDIRDQWPDHYLTLVPKKIRPLFRLALFSEFQRVRRILKGVSGITAISHTFLAWALKYADREKRSSDGIFPMGYPANLSLSDNKIKERQAQLISTYQIRPDSLLVTFTGTLSPSYALETVIEAAHFFDQAGQHNVQLIIIGDGDNGPKLRAQAQGLGNVTFTGWFDQLPLVAMLGISSVGLAPYRDDASMSLPNKPFEYMASGLPILSSLRGELETLIHQEKIGLQYQAGDVSSLVESIRWFLNHTDEQRAMGVRARKLFEERFSTEVVYPKLIKHLEYIVACGTQ